ncbi:MAG: 2-oxoacid:acceptor oxidoreductase subunit alpha [Syntrophomonadaceae bacterium]|nr:2-oxoacid:acceptor oxidoreductase subunit alpha [Syntrophomonadaceae bacterium]
MNILIGGAAGDGMETIAHLLGKTFAREGYGVLTTKDYMSRVRGGHNFSLLRVGTKTPWAAAATVDILVALNEETYLLHRERLLPNSRIVYDPELFGIPSADERGLPISLRALAQASGNKIMANTVATGAVLSILGMELTEANRLLAETFAPDKARQNTAALQAGYDAAAKLCGNCFALPPKEQSGKGIFLDGNQALGLAALGSGCRFLAAYPMTPATGVFSYLAGKQAEFGLVVEQAEDEIAAVNMALGASFAGARAMTCTSGGGFALMAEGLSLAGMTETPLVIIVAMRPGPATGLPTRSEQGDLNFVLHAGHGEFPRAVLCATHLEDAFYRLNKAFDLAEKYQLPVIFLSDQYFADTARTIPPYDFARLCYDRYLVSAEDLVRPYRRYRLTDSGISPRAFPGQFPEEMVLADSDEHDEDGHIIEDAVTRTLMVKKRLQRMEALAAEMDEPELYGHPEPEILLLGWGSTCGILREAIDALQSKHHKAALLHFSDLWPLPKVLLTKFLPRAKISFCVENNATGQFAGLLRRETGLTVDHKVLQYDGRPFDKDAIVREVLKYV